MLLTIYGLFKIYGNYGSFFAGKNDSLLKVSYTDKGTIILKRPGCKIKELFYNSNYKIWY